MNAIDGFLRRHDVDVGKSLGLLMFGASVLSIYTMLGTWIAGTNFTLDLTPPFTVVLGVALWNHRSWARTCLLVSCWMAVGMTVFTALLVPFTGTGSLTLNMGASVIKNPLVWQALAFLVMIAPIFVFGLVLLLSQKAKEEFTRMDQPLEGRVNR